MNSVGIFHYNPFWNAKSNKKIDKNAKQFEIGEILWINISFNTRIFNKPLVEYNF